MSALTLFKKIFIISLFCAVVVLFLIFVLIVPLSRDINRYSKEIVAKKAEQSFLNKELEWFDDFKKREAELRGVLEKEDSLFAKADAPVELIEFWEKIADRHKLGIEILPLPSSEKGSYPFESLSFRLALSGSFSGAYEFLKKVESGPYLVEVSHISVEDKKTNIKVVVFTK